MRFLKGSKVEVLSKKEVATGAWLCAEIISGNGRTYSVKYGWFSVTSDVVVERVPRKAIRPCPPPVERADSWDVGDLVEVFHNVSWKTATIMKVIGGSNFLVRLLGTSHEFRVHESHLRVRQSWEDGKWFVVGKGSENCMMPMNKKCTDVRIKPSFRDDYYPIRKDTGILKPQLISTRKRRSPLVSFHYDAYSTAVHKMRAVEKSECSFQMHRGSPPSMFPYKVDASVSPPKIRGGNYMHASFDTGTTTRFSEIDAHSVKSNFNDNCVPGTLTSSDTDRCASSVASCSVTDNGLGYLPNCCMPKYTKETESHCSDAESFCGQEYEDEGCSHPTNEELMAEVHRSELRAYHCTIKALYASGPLTWEGEEMMTNLRHKLHISDDEHLMEIRNLIAADSRFTLSS